MTRLVLSYLAGLVTLGVIDGVWLGVLARNFYRRELGALMADPVRVAPAALFYLLYPLGVWFLAVHPATRLGDAVVRSLVLGLVAYGTFDLTNLAIIKGWSVRASVVDMMWGAVVTTAVGAAMWSVASRP